MTRDNLPMSQVEFISLCAMMFATIAFSIDAMLPALPEIANELSPGNLNRATLIITSFVMGMGFGTFFTGPLSDAFGRKPVLISGALLYSLCAFVGWKSQSLEWVLAARFVQGVGAAGPRIVTLAIVRDLYSGREMARIMSFAMMIFTLVPAIAPLLGSLIIDLSSWRGIFAAFILFSIASVLWVGIRLPEPLAKENRRAFSMGKLLSGVKEMWAIPAVRTSMLVQSLIFAGLFAMISSVQPIYAQTFDRADEFPLWFAGIALISGTASLLNARLVMVFGMRSLVTIAVSTQIFFAIAILAAYASSNTSVHFAAFVIWQTATFFSIGFTIGNLNALAMEPLGHMAGTAASVMGAFATILGGLLATPIGLAFDGTPLPMAMALGIFAVISFGLMLHMRRLEALAA
ncbi:multidrug effflux MFS transporter [Shimia marina]|uniref:Sulfonamide resistance protein n=1 Tax=Shimia marina TaxID=321267 RepID=A0A0P1ESZ4_9RHOB|nr:multidrug effflux MFS transporter [Shimia marina]CUH53569.1 Sulfonamide resistance protein [Shimia marina]SFD73998.1 MFS transporter, DHA1 family, bicyclomycin/chloramphenicol resistance protein [Shimia marina]